MTTTAPAPHQIANIWTELARLGAPMDGWCAEPDPAEGGPAYWARVHPDALTHSEEAWMVFEWDTVHGWTSTSGCGDGDGTTVLLDVADPFDAPTVAAFFKAVIDGEISEFRRAA